MYFKHIQLNNIDKITEKLQERYKSFESSMMPAGKAIESWEEVKNAIPELDAEFKRLNLEPIDFFLFQIDAQGSFETHIDFHGPEFVHLALNIPVFNCKDTFVTFYKNLEPLYLDRVVLTPYNKNALLVSKSICEPAATLELTTPHLVNVREIHEVTNPTDNIRVIVSIRFKENPLHLWN